MLKFVIQRKRCLAEVRDSPSVATTDEEDRGKDKKGSEGTGTNPSGPPSADGDDRGRRKGERESVSPTDNCTTSGHRHFLNIRSKDVNIHIEGGRQSKWQVTNLAKDQKTKLTRDQITKLTKDQLAKLTKDQNYTILTNEQGIHLNKEQETNLTKEPETKLTKEQETKLTRDQLTKLTKDQMTKLTADKSEEENCKTSSSERRRQLETPCKTEDRNSNQSTGENSVEQCGDFVFSRSASDRSLSSSATIKRTLLSGLTRSTAVTTASTQLQPVIPPHILSFAAAFDAFSDDAMRREEDSTPLSTDDVEASAYTVLRESDQEEDARKDHQTNGEVDSDDDQQTIKMAMDDLHCQKNDLHCQENDLHCQENDLHFHENDLHCQENDLRDHSSLTTGRRRSSQDFGVESIDSGLTDSSSSCSNNSFCGLSASRITGMTGGGGGGGGAGGEGGGGAGGERDRGRRTETKRGMGPLSKAIVVRVSFPHGTILNRHKSGMKADTTPDSSSGVASDEHYYTSENSESSAAVSPFQESLHHTPHHRLQQQQQHHLRTDKHGPRPNHHPASAAAAAARYMQSTPSSDLSGSQSSTTYVGRRMRSNVETTNSRPRQEPHRNQRREEGDDDEDDDRRSNDSLRRQTVNSNRLRNVIHKTNSVHGQHSLNGHSLLPPPTPSDPLHRLSPSVMTYSSPPQLSTSKSAGLSSSYFRLIPDEVMVRIFSYLCSSDLCRCARVCRRWYEVVWNPVLWTTITINDPEMDVDRALRCLTKILSYATPVVCVTVEEIDLSCCERLTDNGLYLVASMFPELRRLQLDGCIDITNIALFEVVSRCVNLEHLSVAGCYYITCISLTPEANIQATTYGKQIDLRFLDLTDCVNLDDSGLQIIVSYCSRLVYLYLRRCVRVTDIGVQYLATYCTSLQELSISDCHCVTDFGLKEVGRLEGRLRYLSIAKCDAVTDAGVKAIIRCCTKLRYMNMRGCHRVTDECVVYLATRCTRLRSLDLGKCGITDRALVGIAEHSPYLRKLSLRGCEWITDRGVVEIARRCRHLLQVNIQDCCLLTIETYKALRHFCRTCVIEHTNPGFH